MNAILAQSNIHPIVIFLVLVVAVIVVLAAIVFWRRLEGSFLLRRFFEIWREEGIQAALKVFVTKIKYALIHRLKKWFPAPALYKNRYLIEDNTEVVLYLNNPEHPLRKLNYQPERLVSPSDIAQPRVKVSLIATVWNEAGNVEEWLQSILQQTRLPDEIVITDAGSTDETVALLEKHASQSPVPIRVLTYPKVNIAKGRNIAIEHARYDTIATADFGCRYHPDWLEKLIAPFELDPDTQVSAGMYIGVDENGEPVNRKAWWAIDTITDPKNFLPSARSSAFTRDIWKLIGGYPEWLSLTGEDSFYALDLKKYSSRWAFVPEAIAEWQAPKTMMAYWKKLYHWSKGDGESGLNGALYWKLTLQVVLPIVFTIAVLLFIAAVLLFVPAEYRGSIVGITIAAWAILAALAAGNLHEPLAGIPYEAGVMVARVLGYRKGAQNRGNVEPNRQAAIKGTIFILSGIPIDDTGGGARCTQIALELLRKKYAIVFINKYPKYESVELNLSIEDAYLFTYQVDDFNWDIFARENAWLLETGTVGALVEMPMPEFVPLIRNIRNQGGIIAYDLLDEWNTALGGKWYTEAVELEIIRESQVLLATAPVLAERLAKISKRNVYFLPNAVNTRLFNPDRHYQKPTDFPEAQWSAIYIGALWGEWFHWNLLTETAKKHPEAAIVVIGDYQDQCPEPPPNLHFLGLKLQRTLPAYLAHADVAIIPWKVNPITQATSPLKIYEYLAMHKPVVAPAIDPLRGIPGVFLANDEHDFVEKVGAAQKADLPLHEISQFIQENNWESRVKCLLEQIQAAQHEGHSR